jgi:hypothetical protein
MHNCLVFSSPTFEEVVEPLVAAEPLDGEASHLHELVVFLFGHLPTLLLNLSHRPRSALLLSP